MLLGTPLIAGLTDETLAIITNADAIAINQDSLAEQGLLRADGGWIPDEQGKTVKNHAYGYQVWSGRLTNNRVAAVLANLNMENQSLTFTEAALPPNAGNAGGKWDIKDAFSGAKHSGVTLPHTVMVGPRDVALWTMSPA